LYINNLDPPAMNYYDESISRSESLSQITNGNLFEAKGSIEPV